MKSHIYYSMLSMNGLGVSVKEISHDLEPRVAYENLKDQERVLLNEKRPFRSVVWPGKRQRKFAKKTK